MSTDHKTAARSALPHHEQTTSRRDMLLRSGAGFGAVALASLLAEQPLGHAASSADETGQPAPHFAPRAKNAIFLFMEGGPSHLDTFDYKPLLNRLAGQSLPKSFKRVITAMGEVESPLLAAPRTWKRHGQSGLWVSEWLPHIAGCVDDLAVIRSCHSDGLNHVGSVCQMNTGSTIAGRPSLGSWVDYGLGTENRDMPAYVVMLDREARVAGGPRNWGTGFMPAAYQGTRLHSEGDPIRNLRAPEQFTAPRQRGKLAYLRQLNELHQVSRTYQTELDARIRSYELAFRMQAAAPEAVDLSQESAETKQLYGLEQKETATFGRNCLLARRLVERGVRFVQLYHGAGSRWDSHSRIEKQHPGLCRGMDQPVAALLKDLKRRGLLDTTLVIWGGEFGRTPMSEKGDGRDHNPTGFTMWMAGGGVQGGRTIGATDELGFHAVEDRLHVHDLHATVLSLMGLGHRRLTYYHKGRPERPTQNEGEPYRQITGA